MIGTAVDPLIKLSVNITKVTTDLLERFTLEFIPEFFSEKSLVVSGDSDNECILSYEDEDTPLFI